jgi:predicted Zn-dependent peptidase
MESVKAIDRDDLINFHRRYFRPDRTILAVAGDVKVPDLIQRLETVFSGWDRASEQLPEIATPAENLKSQVLLARKEINQSVIRMGHLGIDKNNPDLHAIRVMDYILGGGFTSRLTTEIRSNQGLAYNADSHFDIGRRFVGTFIAETETKSESTARAIGLIRSIIAGLTTDPVTDKELVLAKDSIINAFIFGFAKPDAVVNQQARLEYYGYPEGYLDRYRDNIARVSKDDVLRVARKYLHPDSMLITVVGKEASFDKPLSTFAPVTEIKLTSPTDETPK